MFSFRVVLSIAICLIMTACNLISGPSTEQRLPDNEQTVDRSRESRLDNCAQGNCDDLLLEITTTRNGQTTPRGTVVDIRVKTDGLAEYDYFVVGEDDHEIVRRVRKLSNKELDELFIILKSVNNEALKTEFMGDYYCCDVSLRKKIILKNDKNMKEVLISEDDVVIHRNRSEKIPKSLLRLIEYVDLLVEVKSPSITE